jgi:type II secretory pathway component GspD/PulD (secretin)
LEKDDKGQRQSGSGLVTFLPRGPGKEGEGNDDEEPIRFKGLLSIGIEESSNTLIVSSTGSLMDTIATMIEDLDKAADSSSVVKVVNVDKSVDLGMIQERLRELMKASESKGQQEPGQKGQPGQPGEGQPGAEAAAAAAAAAAGGE